jgi:hypothetical protein
MKFPVSVRPIKSSEVIESQVVVGALLGVDMIAVIEMLGLSFLDTPLKISLYSFASAIQALATEMVNLVVMSRYKRELLTCYNTLAFLAGILASLFGIDMLFWHFSNKAGILFTILTVFGVINYFTITLRWSN